MSTPGPYRHGPRLVAQDREEPSAGHAIQADDVEGARTRPRSDVCSALYTAALVADIVGKEHHLTDPAWLLRIGVHLELITCLGIFEAVRDDIGDLLDADERAAYENSDALAETRAGCVLTYAPRWRHRRRVAIRGAISHRGRSAEERHHPKPRTAHRSARGDRRWPELSGLRRMRGCLSA